MRFPPSSVEGDVIMSGYVALACKANVSTALNAVLTIALQKFAVDYVRAVRIQHNTVLCVVRYSVN